MSQPSREQHIELSQKAVKRSEATPPSASQYRTLVFSVSLLAAVCAFAFLTVLVQTTPSFPIDLQMTRLLQSINSPVFASLMWLISWPGFLPQSVIITLLIAFLFYMYGLRWESVTSLIAACFSGATNALIKDFIQRPRPSADLVEVFRVLSSYSFPSGHVMFYFILFGFVWYVMYTRIRASWMRSIILVLLGVSIALVGVSRIYLGQHWASDVLGAYLLGGLILVGVILLYQWGNSRFSVYQAAIHPTGKAEK